MSQDAERSFRVYNDASELDKVWQSMLTMAKELVSHSYAPYSNFHVVAVAQTADGSMLSGTNQENSSFQAGICAERNLVYHAMHVHPDLHIKRMLIYTSAEFDRPDTIVAPCGICRQTLAELEFKQKADLEVMFPGKDGNWIHSKRMDDLLPFAFRLK
jgi:cytidine deaminase